MNVAAIERGEVAGEDLAAVTGLETGIVIGVGVELGQLGEVDDAIGAVGVGIDLAARLGGDVAEVDLAAGLGVDGERRVSRRAVERGQAGEVEHAACTVGQDRGAVGLGELSKGRKRQIATAVGIEIRRGDRGDLAGGDRRLVVVELNVATIERGEVAGEDRAAVTGLEAGIILGVREELGQLREVDDAICAVGVGIDSAARLGGDVAEVDFAARLGVDVERRITGRADMEVKLVRSSTLPAPLAWIVAPLGSEILSQGRKRQIAAAVDSRDSTR